MERCSNVLLHPSLIYRITKLYTDEKKICDYLCDHMPKLLTRTNENYTLYDGTTADFKDTKSINLIDKLMQMEHYNLMDPKCVLDHLNTFAFAVSENTIYTK